MSDFAVPKTIDELGTKVDFIPISPPRENAIEGGELHEHRADDELATNNVGDGEGDEQGEQAPISQLQRSNREHCLSNKYPSLKTHKGILKAMMCSYKDFTTSNRIEGASVG